MKNNILTLLFVAAVSFNHISAQIPLAEFGGKSIDKDEFKFRFELSPRAGASADYNLQKEQFLYTLISEKLWALEASRLGLANNQDLDNYLTIIEKLYLRDKVFNAEISEKVEVSENELAEGLSKIDKELSINFLYSQSKGEIDSLYDELNKGTNFISLLNTRPEMNEQLKNITVVYGQVDERKEGLLFDLAPNSYSEPVKEDIGWVIYYLKSVSVSKLTSGMSFEQKKKSVLEVIENREKKHLMDSFIKGLYGEESINVDRDLFNKLTSVLIEVAVNKCKNIECDKGSRIVLYEPDFEKVKSEFSFAEKFSDFIKFDNNPVDLNYFIDDLSFKEFSVHSVSAHDIKRSLSGYVREFITLELIVREAERRNYKLNEETIDHINLWRDNYLSQLLKNEYTDSASVSDEEAYNNYMENKNDSSFYPIIKISEIYTGDLGLIEDVLDKLSGGADFNELAEKYSSNAGGSSGYTLELGYGTEFYELRKEAEKLNVGDIGGPISKGSGYSLFKVIEKEKSDSVFNKSFDNAKQLIKQKMFYENMERLIKKNTIEFAKRYDLKVNKELLKEIETTEINALIYRHFGFGGRILGAPFLNMFYEWYEDYQKEINEPL